MSIIDHVRELWAYRDLLYNLVRRDIKVRYRNSVLGMAWSWINPLLMMLVYTVVFNVLAGRSDLPNYPIFLLCGLLPWQFFTSSISQSAGSVVDAANLVKKVYFPREILPVATILSNMVNFIIALPIFFGFALISGHSIRFPIIMLPVAILVHFFLTTGLGLIFSTLNVFYRDTKHILSFLLMAWFFLTPIFYPANTVPEQVSLLGISMNVRAWWYRLNPMASMIAIYRNTMYWGEYTEWGFMLRTVVTSLLIFVIGYSIFLHFSRKFGEEL